MKALLLILVFLSSFIGATRGATAPTALDLAGKWDGEVAFGKFNFKLILRVARTPEGKLAVTMDNPDQGQKGMPISALLFNNPDVRLEIDQFGTAYSGKLSADLNQIVGEFEEGPGGRPIPVTFKRNTTPDAPEPEKTFTFTKDEKTDIRGYWKGEIEAGPGMKVTAALNVGRIPDGTFRASLDLLDQGAKDIPATSVGTTNQSAIFEWKGFRAVFDSKLSEDGKTLSGGWVQGGKTNPVSFARLDEPASLLPKEVSFEPDKSKTDDIRGYWKGTLEIPGGKLRLVLKVGRAPDGSYTGTLASLDQGGQELPMSSASYTSPKANFEWKGIRGKYDGKMNEAGTEMEGTWEQFGNPTPLKLERTTAEEAKKT